MPETGTVSPGLYDITDSLVIDNPSWEIGWDGIQMANALRGIKSIAEILFINPFISVTDNESGRSGAM